MFFMAVDAPYRNGRTAADVRLVSPDSCRVDDYISDVITRSYGPFIMLADWTSIDCQAN